MGAVFGESSVCSTCAVAAGFGGAGFSGLGAGLSSAVSSASGSAGFSVAGADASPNDEEGLLLT